MEVVGQAFVGLFSLPKAMKVVRKKVMNHWEAALPKLTYNYITWWQFFLSPFNFWGGGWKGRSLTSIFCRGLWQVPEIVSCSKQAPTLLHAMLLRLGSWNRRRRGAFVHVGLGGLECVFLQSMLQLGRFSFMLAMSIWFSFRGHLHSFMAVFAKETPEILPGITDYQLIGAYEAGFFFLSAEGVPSDALDHLFANDIAACPRFATVKIKNRTGEAFGKATSMGEGPWLAGFLSKELVASITRRPPSE